MKSNTLVHFATHLVARPSRHAKYLLVRLDPHGPLPYGSLRSLPKHLDGADVKERAEAAEPEKEIADAEQEEQPVRKEFKKKGKKSKKGAYRWIPAGPVSTYGVDLGDAHQQNIDYIDYY